MACIRYLIILMVTVVLALAVTPFEASAQSGSCPVNNTTCDQGTAYAGCMSHGSSNLSANPAYAAVQCNLVNSSSAQAYYRCFLSAKASPGTFAYACNDPRDWYFRTASSCSARPDGEAGMINGTLYSGGVCDKGCKVNPNLDRDSDFTLKEQGNANAISIRSGTWKPSGAVCSPLDGEQKPEKKDEFCHTTSSGHKVCKSKDKTCVTTQSGFRTCASDTGNTKGHIETNKGRTEATSISAPDTPPSPPINRPGEDWQQTGNSTNITNNTKNTGNTTNNYYNNGKPNGNDTVPGDGSGPGAGGSNGGGNGEGEGGEGQGNSATGGGDCKTPPVVTGDAALGMVATQAWATRCAVEAGASAKVTGDIGDCASPFTVEGDTPEAHQLRATRAQRCSAPEWAKAGEGDGNNGNPHDGAEGVDGPGNSTWTFDVDVLDTSGFGGGSCPQLGTLDFGRFGAVAMDGATWWCPLIAGIRAVMLLMGVFISFRILFGE